MTKLEASAEFISAHLHGETGAQLETQWLEAYNGQQRVTGLNNFTDTVPQTSIGDIMAVTALLAKEDAAPRTPAAAPKPRLH